MNMVERLHEVAREHPDQPALVAGRGGRERVAGFRELSGRVAEVAGGLRECGLEPGDRLIAFHPVAVELYEILLGAFHAGVTVVLADPAGGAEFLRGVVGRTRPKAFFGSRAAQWLRWRHRELGRIPVALHPRGWCPGSRAVGGREIGIFEAEPGFPALITFTSGSTGRPKGVVRSHGFLLAQHRTLEQTLRLRPGQCDLVTLPVFALANLASGVTSVIADADLRRPGEARSGPIRRQCAKWQVRRATASPAFFEALLAGGGLPEFDQVFTGGAPVFPDLMERLVQARPEMKVTAVYGSTEAEPVAELAHRDLGAAEREEIRSGGGLPAGRPVLDVAILRDRFGESVAVESGEEFDALKVESGEAGEIVVAGPQVLDGYLDGEGDEETKIRVGGRTWHRTGDAGRLDAQGRLWLLGRCEARMHLRGGRTAYPFAIEAALREAFPGCRTAAIEWRNHAVLVLERGAPDGMAEHARTLGCERIVELPAVPMDRRHQAKVDYPELRRMLER